MPVYTVDLHNHTPLIPSDWRGRPGTTAREVVETALERGIDVWGATDHFSVDYAGEMLAAAEEVHRETGRRLLVVPGAELKVRHDGEETHLVCLFDPESVEASFHDLMARLGMASPAAAVDDLPHVSVDRDPHEIAHMVAELGGICHIGHVDRSFGEYCFLDSKLVHDLAACEHVAAVEMIDHACVGRFPDGLAFARISSSDSHALEEIGRRTAHLEMPELSFEGLREGLRAARSSNGARAC